jgi:outer membrane receptor protein involved in Fe transport
LRQVGTQGVPDAYSHPRHMIDFVISQKFLDHWNAQLSIENIANDDVLWTQGQEVSDENIAMQYQTGTTFGLQIGYEL